MGKAYSRLDGLLDCYIVTSQDGTTFVTAAHRLRRHRA